MTETIPVRSVGPVLLRSAIDTPSRTGPVLSVVIFPKVDLYSPLAGPTEVAHGVRTSAAVKLAALQSGGRAATGRIYEIRTDHKN